MREELGTPGEYFKYKIGYFVWIAIVILFLFFAYIGKAGSRQMITFYLLFALFALFFILFDNATKHSFQQIDTVTVEKPTISFLGPKISLLIALFFGILFGVRIYTTHQAWVNYPQFQLFDSKYANALLSGFAGIVENWVFFAFLFPTLFALINLKLKMNIFSFLLSASVTSFVFMFFHVFVYGALPSVLLTTAFFAFVQCTTVWLFKNMLIADALHFTNNFVATLANAAVGLVIQW